MPEVFEKPRMRPHQGVDLVEGVPESAWMFELSNGPRPADNCSGLGPVCALRLNSGGSLK